MSLPNSKMGLKLPPGAAASFAHQVNICNSLYFYIPLPFFLSSIYYMLSQSQHDCYFVHLGARVSCLLNCGMLAAHHCPPSITCQQHPLSSNHDYQEYFQTLPSISWGMQNFPSQETLALSDRYSSRCWDTTMNKTHAVPTFRKA